LPPPLTVWGIYEVSEYSESFVKVTMIGVILECNCEGIDADSIDGVKRRRNG